MPIDRSQQLIESLGLLAHPEGGFYRRLYLSDAAVLPADGRPRRQALSAILFLLRADDHSRWHQLDSDEVWTWIEGAPAELRCFDAHTGVCGEHLLAAPGRGLPLHGVLAGQWQTARSTGAYTLLSCAVAPAFEFADFRFMSDRPEARSALAARQPQWLEFL